MAKPVVNVDVTGNTSKLEANINKAVKGKRSLNLDTSGFSAPLGKIKGELGEFDKSLAASNARVLAFGASAGAIYAIQRALSETVQATIQVEKALSDVNVILGASEKRLASFGDRLFDIAKKTGSSFQDVALAGAELARQGLAMEQTLRRTSDAMILARLSGLGVEASVNAITAALNGFRSAALTSTAVIDKIIAVDQAFAVSGADLAEALRRVGSTAEGAGVSLNELLGIVTAAQQITARGGSVIGNSFKTIFTRIQRPRVIKELENLGVATKDAAGASLSAINVLRNLASTFDTLGEAQQAQIAELVGGVFQINVLKASLSDLSSQYSVFENATRTAAQSSGEAAARNALLNKTLSAGLNETLQNLTKLAAGVGKLTLEPAIRNVLDIVNAITEKVSLSDAEDKGSSIGKAVLGGIGKFLSGPGLAIAAVAIFQLFNNLRKFAVDAFTTFSGLNNSIKQQMQLQQGVANILNQNPEILARIRNGEISVEQAANEIVNSYKHLNSELVQANNLAAQLANTIGRTQQVGSITPGGPQTLVPRGRAKASGYVPNFNNAPEVAAMIQSGMYTKSQINNPRVRKGRVYDGQGGSFMASYNGYEKKRDVIGPNGRKGTIIENPLMQKMAQGFIPNFVRARQTPALVSSQQSQFKKDWEAANPGQTLTTSTTKTGKTTLKTKDGKVPNIGGATPSTYVRGKGKLEKRRGGGTRTVDLGGKIGIIAATIRDKILTATTDQALTQSFLKSQGIPLPKEKGATKSAIIKGINVVRPKNLKGDGKIEEKISSTLVGPIARAIGNVSKQLFSPRERELPNTAKVREYLNSEAGKEKLAVVAGSIFEDAINVGINLKDKSAGARWDYTSGDFTGKLGMLDALVGKKNRSKFATPGVVSDAKLTFPTANPADMLGKIYSAATPAPIKKQIANAFLAHGYVPNFYKPLRQAITRENNAGVSKSAIRVGSDRRLASGANPFGLAVTNTRDEPRGLRDVLGKGYVPNFVAPPPMFAPNRLSENYRRPSDRGNSRAQRSQPISGTGGEPPAKDSGGSSKGDTSTKSLEAATSKQAKAMEKATQMQTKLMGAMMLANLASSTFASATENSSGGMKSLANATNGLVQGVSAAATIMMAFPGAMPLAVLAGIGVAAVSFTNSMNYASEQGLKYAEALKARAEELGDQGVAIQGAQQAISAYKTALDSGNVRETNEAQKKVASALQALDPALRAQVMAAQDSAEQQRILAKAASETGAEKTQVDKAGSIREQKNKEDEKLAKEKTMSKVYTALGGIAALLVGWFAYTKLKGAGSSVLSTFNAGAQSQLISGPGKGLAAGTSGGAKALSSSTSIFQRALGRLSPAIVSLSGSATAASGTLVSASGSAATTGSILGGLAKGLAIGAAKLGGIAVIATQVVSGLSGFLGKFTTAGSTMNNFFGSISKATDAVGIFGDFLESRKGLDEAEANLSNMRYNKSFDPAAGFWDNLKIPLIKGVKEGNVQSMDEEGRKQMQSDAAALLNILDTKGMATGENITKLKDAAKKGEAALIDAFVDLGFEAEVVASHIEGAGDASRNLAQQIMILDNTRNAEIATIRRQQAVLNAQKAAAQSAADALRLANQRSFEFVEGIQAFGVGLAKFRAQAVTNTRGMLSEIAKGGRKLAKQFMTAEQGTLLDRGGASQAINEQARQASNKARDKGMNSMIDAVEKFGPIGDLLKQRKEDPGSMSPEQRMFLGALGNIQTRGALGGAGAGEIAPAIQKLLGSQLGEKALGGKQDIRNIPGLQKVLLQQVAEMREAEQTRQQQLRMANLQFTLQRMQDKINREQNMGGGIKAFLDPKQMDDMEDGFNQAVDDFRTASKRGDTVKTGQAAGNLLSNLQDFMGGAAVGPGFEGLKDLTQKGLEQSLRGRAMARAEVMEQAGRETGNQDLIKAAQALRNMDFASAAATQTALEFKRQRMPANIEGMLGVQRAIQQLQQSDVVANQSTAQATQGTLNFLTGGGMQAAMSEVVAAINADPNAAGAPGARPGMSGAIGADEDAAVASKDEQKRLETIKRATVESGKKGIELEGFIENARQDGFSEEELAAIRDRVLEIKKLDQEAADAFKGLGAQSMAQFSPAEQQRILNRGQQAGTDIGGGYATAHQQMAPMLHEGINVLRDERQRYQSPAANTMGNRLSQREAQSAQSFIKTKLADVETMQKEGKSASEIRNFLAASLTQQQERFREMKDRGGRAAELADSTIPVMSALQQLLTMTQQAQTRGDNRVLGAGFMGGETQFDRQFADNIMRQFSVNNVINVTIPANLSGTGRDQIYTINNRLQNIQNSMPASQVGPTVAAPPVQPHRRTD